MKYKVTLNGRTYEVEVEAGKAMLVDEYEAYAPAPAAPGRREAGRHHRAAQLPALSALTVDIVVQRNGTDDHHIIFFHRCSSTSIPR